MNLQQESFRQLEKLLLQFVIRFLLGSHKSDLLMYLLVVCLTWVGGAGIALG
jgi:hypothetical protein